MDDWLKEFQAQMRTVAKDSSNLFAEISQQTNDAVDALISQSVETIDEVSKAVEPTLQTMSDRLDDSIMDGLVFIETEVVPKVEAAAAPLTRTVNPWLQNHPTCIGCEHYHGTSYGADANMLVCGMHPYGPDEDGCADWKDVWTP